MTEMLGSIELNRVYQMDCLEGMRNLIPDNSIDLTITSPPYDKLRTYNGYSFDFEGIANELWRVTKEGGVIVWIVREAVINGSETGTALRQALYFMDIGFKKRTMIYRKLAGSMSGSLNFYRSSFEHMYVFSKGIPKTKNLIRDLPNKYAGQKRTITKRKANGEMKKEHTVVKEFATRTDVWDIDVGYMRSTKDKIAYKHPAIFPEVLARDHIISWSNEGDLVLDPFMGSGTTAKMAIKNNRKFIGFEISQEYIEITNKRLESLT